MHAPQIIYLVMAAINITLNCFKIEYNGKSYGGNLSVSVIRNGMIAGLLYWGGFFNQP